MNKNVIEVLKVQEMTYSDWLYIVCSPLRLVYDEISWRIKQHIAIASTIVSNVDNQRRQSAWWIINKRVWKNIPDAEALLSTHLSNMREQRQLCCTLLERDILAPRISVQELGTNDHHPGSVMRRLWPGVQRGDRCSCINQEGTDAKHRFTFTMATMSLKTTWSALALLYIAKPSFCMVQWHAGHVN